MMSVGKVKSVLSAIEPIEPRVFYSATAPQEPGLAIFADVAVTPRVLKPSVRSVKPGPGSINFATTSAVQIEVNLPSGSLKDTSLNSNSVYLTRVSNGVRVPAVVSTSGGGDVIIVKPNAALAPFTQYLLTVTSLVKDVKGNAFTPYSSKFTTGAATPPPTSSIKFSQLPQSTSAGHRYFGLTMGPDGRLYAGGADGKIYRFDIKPDGSLSAPTVISTISSRNGGARFVVGLAFAPGSTASNLTLWVSHSATSALELGGAAGPDWTGKISVLSGANLENYRDAVIHLPRSIRDHVTDQLAFGPDGGLYFCQPSMSSLGRADVIWGNRPEHLLSAAILRLNTAAVGGTLDARTPDGGGTYNPFAAGAPLTIYADGVRNSFDLVWHRNGKLYAPTNGSAVGGNTPAGDGAPALTNVGTPETDYLFQIQKGGYYGHPNPLRGYFILNGGNPTAGVDQYQVPEYPVGTKPDPNWRRAVYNFGTHQSPAGTIEYKGGAFGGQLDRRLLVTRYSSGNDIIVLTLNATGGVAKAQTGIVGLTNLADPVDLVEHQASGNMYVIELAKNRITLLKPA